MLGQIRGREVYGDAFVGHRKAGSLDRGTHPVAAFFNGCFNQPDNVKTRQARSQENLDADQRCIQTRGCPAADTDRLQGTGRDAQDSVSRFSASSSCSS